LDVWEGWVSSTMEGVCSRPLVLLTCWPFRTKLECLQIFVFQRFQKCVWSSEMSLQRLKCDFGFVFKFGSTFAVLGISVRKWLFVRTSKSRSGLRALNGREFNVASIVLKGEIELFELESMETDCSVDLCFCRLHSSLENLRSEAWMWVWCYITCWYYVPWGRPYTFPGVQWMAWSTVSNNLNVHSHYLCVCCIWQLREMRRLKTIRNGSVDKSETSSRCSAFVAMQTKRYMYAWHGTVLCVVDGFNTIVPAHCSRVHVLTVGIVN